MSERWEKKNPSNRNWKQNKITHSNTKYSTRATRISKVHRGKKKQKNNNTELKQKCQRHQQQHRTKTPKYWMDVYSQSLLRICNMCYAMRLYRKIFFGFGKNELFSPSLVIHTDRKEKRIERVSYVWRLFFSLFSCRRRRHRCVVVFFFFFYIFSCVDWYDDGLKWCEETVPVQMYRNTQF